MSLVRRLNQARNPIGANVSVTTGLFFTRVTGAANTGFVRCTITDALAAAFAQRLSSPTSPATDMIPVTPAVQYTANAEGRSDVTVANLGIRLQFLDAALATVGTVDGATTPVNATSSTFLPIATATTTAPATAAWVIAQVGIPGTTARSVAQIFDVRRCLVEEGGSVGTYFDGSFTDTAEFDYSWTGTAELSPSIEASNTRRVLNQGSLTQSAVRAATI